MRIHSHVRGLSRPRKKEGAESTNFTDKDKGGEDRSNQTLETGFIEIGAWRQTVVGFEKRISDSAGDRARKILATSGEGVRMTGDADLVHEVEDPKKEITRIFIRRLPKWEEVSVILVVVIFELEQREGIGGQSLINATLEAECIDKGNEPISVVCHDGEMQW